MSADLDSKAMYSSTLPFPMLAIQITKVLHSHTSLQGGRPITSTCSLESKGSPSHANCAPRDRPPLCGILNSMSYRVDFGEPGKNFIETGKRSKVQETILRLALSFEAYGISQRWRNNAETRTWKKQIGGLGSRPRLHGDELLLWPTQRQAGDDATASCRRGSRHHL